MDGIKVERLHEIRLWGVTRDDSDRIEDKLSFGRWWQVI